MTTTTENQMAKPKQVPDFYIFENGAEEADPVIGNSGRFCSIRLIKGLDHWADFPTSRNALPQTPNNSFLRS